MPCHELELIQRIRRSRPASRRKPASGIGDDCAVLAIPRGHELLVTTDFSLEDIHFRREWHPADSVGHRCLARGLSDIAAMGGIPHSAFLSLALPSELPQRWVDDFIRGFLKLARRYSVHTRRRRHRSISRRHPRRHHRGRQRSHWQSHAALRRPRRRHHLRERNPRRLRRHAAGVAQRQEAPSLRAPPPLLSRSPHRHRPILAREEARYRHDRHQRRPLHRPPPHLRRKRRRSHRRSRRSARDRPATTACNTPCMVAKTTSCSSPPHPAGAFLARSPASRSPASAPSLAASASCFRTADGKSQPQPLPAAGWQHFA